MIPDLGSNRLAFMPADSIEVQYSRDGGETWSDYPTSDTAKLNFFNGNGASHVIGANSSTGIDKSNYQLRFIITTNVAKVYTVLNKFCIYCSTNGSSGSWCTIDGKTKSNVDAGNDTWTIFANKVPISGWSGYNIINTSGITTYGNQAYHFQKLRFTFGVNSHPSTSTYAGLSVYRIYGFGGVGWNTPSNMARYGRIYSYDSQQNVTFPGSVTATEFSGLVGGYTASRALVSNSSGKIAVSAVTSTELGYLDGVTSNIQTQLNSKLNSSSYTASDILTKLKTVHGANSGLDADLLDGTHKSGLFTALSSNTTTNLSITIGGTTKSIADLAANTAAKLQTARTLWGKSFDGTANVTGALTSVTDITGTGTFTSANTKVTDSVYINGIRLYKSADGTIKIDGNLLVTGGITAYSTGEEGGGSGGGIDVDVLWEILGGEGEQQINIAHLTDALSGYLTTVNLATITDLHSSWDAVLKAQKPNYLTSVSIATISDLNSSWDALLKATPSIYVTRHPTISEVTGKQNLIIKLNSGTTEGTNMFTYNATTAKTVNITPSAIGAAVSSHNHSWSNITSGKPTTLSGYGITDGVNAVSVTGSGNAVTSASISGHTLTLTKGSTFSLSGHTHSYLPLSGGTLTGPLMLKSNQYYINNVCGIDAQNSDIVGINSIYFNDAADTNEGINFYRDGTHWDGLAAYQGTLYFYPNMLSTEYQRNGYKIWHEGNMGSGSGLDADKLDSYNETAFPRLVGIKNGTWNWNDVIRAGYYKIQNGTITNHPSGVYTYGMAEVITTENHADGENRELQIYYPHHINDGNAIYLRMHNHATQGSGWGDWVAVPSTDGNIYSATKLETARTIWGQSFNGTANVTGTLSSVNGINFVNTGAFNMDASGNFKASANSDNYYWNIFKYNGQHAITVKGQSGNIGINNQSPLEKLDVVGIGKFGTTNKIYIGDYGNGDAGIYSEDTSHWLRINAKYNINISANPNATNNDTTYQLHLSSSGNVGIGTQGPSAKLHVAGNILATGGITCYSSDQRAKTVLEHIDLKLKDIANAPTIRFRWNDWKIKDDGKTHIGGIAQYMQKLLPETVLEADGALNMDYATTGYIFAVQTARHLQTYETRTDKELRRLKKRVLYLEQQLKKLGYEEADIISD